MRGWQTYSCFHLVRGKDVGQGTGTLKGAAKRQAAKIVLANFKANGVPSDPAVVLNILLQNHPTGNLTPHFHWAMDKEGQDKNAIHIVTAMCGYHTTE
jgi:hypothetical protein